MSVAQFQQALAMLIRLPDHNRSHIEDFLNKYHLSSEEKHNLKAMALEREVTKFAHKMRFGRIAYLRESLMVSLKLHQSKEIINWIVEEFDYEYTHTDIRYIYKAFDEFLETNGKYEKLKQLSGKEYFADLIRFELSEAEMEFSGLKNSTISRSPSSPLLCEIKLLELHFHIPCFVQAIKDNDEFWEDEKMEVSFAPERKNTYLFYFQAPKEDLGFRMFEIDKELYTFLKNIEQGIALRELKKPDAFEQLVELGICRP